MEIDEYRNYEKALSAMKEALRQAGKIKEEGAKEARLTDLQGKDARIGPFACACALIELHSTCPPPTARVWCRQDHSPGALRCGPCSGQDGYGPDGCGVYAASTRATH